MTIGQIVSMITQPMFYILNLPLNMFGVTGKLKRVSAATLIAILLFLFLVILEVTAFLFAIFTPGSAAGWTWMLPGNNLYHAAALIALPIVIPLVVRQAIIYWMEPDISPYPDIDQAWNAGVAALKEQGIQLTQTPLFLVFGVKDEVAAESLMQASGQEWVVKQTPGGKAPIQWYASKQAAFICCVDCSLSSKLAGTEAVAVSMPRGEMTLDNSLNAIKGTVDFGNSMSGKGSLGDLSSYASGTGRGRNILEDSSFGKPRAYTGTLDGFGPSPSMDGPMLASSPSPSSMGMASLNNSQTDLQSRRLAYLCRLIRRNRDPYCPVNGALSVLPYKLIQVSDLQALELARAVRDDAETIRSNLSLRCSVLGLVTGLESEQGFCELKRRLGRRAARDNRFGKGFRRMWVAPDAEQVEALTVHACQQFESWTYHLFRQENALQKIGNPKLYALLCRIRTQLRNRLVETVSMAYAHDPDRDRGAQTDRMLFGGLYFGAAGESDDVQGFVKGVFDKLTQREEIIEWTPDIIARDRSYWRWATISTLIFWVMLLAIAGMVYWMNFRK